MPHMRREIVRPVPGVVWLASSALALMNDEASAKAPLETGGVLMGYRGEESGEPVVTHAIGPGPRAVHDRVAFLPDQIFHVKRIAEIYRASGRRISYLGDWHTHPGGSAYLSECDEATLMLIALNKKARAPQPVMLILCPGPIWLPHAWIGQVVKHHIWRSATLEARKARIEQFQRVPSQHPAP